jgi:gliding motility-associated-like protein
MKKLLLLLLLGCCISPAFANHLKGGFFTYKYLGPGTNNTAANRYEITLTVYMSCDATGGQLSSSVPFTIFNTGGAEVSTMDAPLIGFTMLQKTRPEDCILNQPDPCYYRVDVFRLSNVELVPTSAGYTISYQRCCRIAGISNMVGPSNSIGNTYSIAIPGNSVSTEAPQNSSATFLVNDTVIICRGSFFQYSFKASDPNSDVLTYSFCDAWEGGGTGTGNCLGCNSPDPAAPPPYPLVAYESGFSGSTPLGSRVTINPTTGLISGIAPDVGEYVVTVCVNEIRNGVVIARNRKELHIKVEDCTLVRATLEPSYVNCKDFNVQFFNNTPNGVISNSWDFGVPGLTNDTSNLAAPLFSYPDTGLYQVKLVVNRGDKCADSAISPVRVYPGFFTGFRWQGICSSFPTQFFDTTRTLFGVVDRWSWNFGDLTTLADTAHLRTPTYSYGRADSFHVQLIVGTSKGCLDTVTRTVSIMDKPPITMPYRDTLMCKGDTMQLRAVGEGNFSWTPNGQMLNPNSATPLVWPDVTTVYTATLNDNGCINSDTLRVRVVNFVTLRMNPDTTVCFSDSARLGAFSNGLRYLWSPAGRMNDSTLRSPTVLPDAPLNTYQLSARIGHCIATDVMRVRTVPYPQVSIIGDTTICFRASVQLQATSNGTSFEWSPKTWLTNANTLTPTARPPETITYVLTVNDSLSGCPKPSTDTVVVNVMPRIFPDAGNDTMVVAGQPVQLHASGGVRYQWMPAYGLDRADTSDPVGFYDIVPEYINYVVRVFDSRNCVDSARVRVRIFRTEPSIFVPTAFTPNGDGRNDVVKPIAVGMRTIRFFRIFNRWGQLVFETTVNGAGWDGRINGKDQGTNVFVWVVEAEDYKGARYFRKGTVTLIR